MKKAVLAMVAALSLISVNASARPEHHGRWRCERAAENLRAAQQYNFQMQEMVNNNWRYCPGGWDSNAACMMTIANGYNQSVVNLQNAQGEYNRACFGHH